MNKKILILLGLSLALVSCKKEVKEESKEQKKEVTAVKKEIKIEEKNEKKPGENKEVVAVFGEFLGKIYSNGKETVTILGEDDLKDGTMEKEFGKLNVGDIHIYEIEATNSGKIYKNAKIEKINGVNTLTAEGLDRKFIILDENTIKDEITGNIYKKM